MLFNTLVKMTTPQTISCPATFHGNLHPKYASLKGGRLATQCQITSILGCKLDVSTDIAYSTNDINWLGEFYFKDCKLATDILCMLDRWYTFDATIIGIQDDRFILSNLHITSIDTDTDIGLARKRRCLRLSM